MKKQNKIGVKINRRIDESIEMETKNYIIDLGSFNVEATSEEEATNKAVEMIDEGGWVKIDAVIED